MCEKILPHLDAGRPALTAQLSENERVLLRGFFLLTSKPTIYACNVSESELSQPESRHIQAVREFAAAQNAGGAADDMPQVEAIVISAQIESELAELPADEAREFLADLGVADSGVSQLIRAVYHLLGLRTYFTTGPKETRAWTIHAGDKAPAAAGVIHSDFERGFIAAQTIAFDELIGFRLGNQSARGWQASHRRQGLHRPGRRRDGVSLQRIRPQSGNVTFRADLTAIMHRVAAVIAHLVVRRPIVMAVAGLLLAAGSVAIISSQKAFDSDILNLLPANNPAVQGPEDLQQRVHPSTRARLSCSPGKKLLRMAMHSVKSSLSAFEVSHGCIACSMLHRWKHLAAARVFMRSLFRSCLISPPSSLLMR